MNKKTTSFARKNCFFDKITNCVREEWRQPKDHLKSAMGGEGGGGLKSENHYGRTMQNIINDRKVFLEKFFLITALKKAINFSTPTQMKERSARLYKINVPYKYPKNLVHCLYSGCKSLKRIVAVRPSNKVLLYYNLILEC